MFLILSLGFLSLLSDPLATHESSHHRRAFLDLRPHPHGGVGWEAQIRPRSSGSSFGIRRGIRGGWRRESADSDRFYIMRLQDRPLQFSAITHHASVTQCLGSIAPGLYLGVAKTDAVSRMSLLPASRGLRGPGFRPHFLKLQGTWHASPLFKADAMDFYNLELSNTNVIDHTAHHFQET